MRESFTSFELAGWSDPATCAQYHKAFGAITVQSVPALLDAGGVKNGTQVLDVCCGAGYAAGLAVDRGAQTVGIDFSQAQVELAKEQYPQAHFEQGDATAMRFDENSFDCVVNSIGMPHFENPDAAIREAFRVLKPGGRFAFSDYDDPSRAVGFGLVYSAIGEHGSLDVGLPPGPNFFLFSDPYECKARLSKAGFVNVATETVPQSWNLRNVDELFIAIVEGSVRASATFRGQTVEAQSKIRQQIRDTLEVYSVGSGYVLPMPAFVVSATRP